MLRQILSLCDERLTRQITGLLSLCLEHGGQAQLARITSLCEETISRGRRELLGELPSPPPGRIRAGNQGRRKVEEQNPQIEAALLEIVEAHKAGDPNRLDVWAGRSLDKLREAMAARGHVLSKNTLRRLLKKTGSPSSAIASLSPVRPTPTATRNSSGFEPCAMSSG
jgi:hypothetical protein